MRMLIDTNIAVWAVLNDPKLPQKAKDMLLNVENEIFYSTASVWKITTNINYKFNRVFICPQ